jgi:hypothetical protein
LVDDEWIWFWADWGDQFRMELSKPASTSILDSVQLAANKFLLKFKLKLECTSRGLSRSLLVTFSTALLTLPRWPDCLQTAYQILTRATNILKACARIHHPMLRLSFVLRSARRVTSSNWTAATHSAGFGGTGRHY